LKILYLSLTPSMPFGAMTGYGTHMREVCKALGEAGHDVLVSVAAGGALLAPAAVERALDVSRSPGPGHRQHSTYELLKRALPPGVYHLARDGRELVADRIARHRLQTIVRQHEVDAVYERHGMLTLAGMRAAAMSGVPHLLEVNAPIEERRDHYGFPLYRLARRVQRLQFELADQIVCVSSTLQSYLVERGADRERVHVIPNAVAADRLARSAGERRSTRLQLGIGDDDLVFGFVGRFAYWRGMLPMIDALGEALRRTPNAHAVLIGDGQMMAEVRRAVEQSDMGGRMHLTGSVGWQDVGRYLAALDVGILASSNWYSSPLKIFEYGAAGLCVVAPRFPPIEEIMEHDVDAVLVPPDDVAALARALVELATDDARRRRLADSLRRRVREHHTWSSVAGRIIRVIESSPRRGKRRRDPAVHAPASA
jgi:glycosyltransferase involved in cell wall biosynthesis